VAALIAAVMSWTAGAAAFESRTSSPIATVAAAALRPAATPAAVSSTATERPLETRTRVAADARGISREIFAGSGRATDARRARFAREKDGVILNHGVLRARSTSSSFDQFAFGVCFVRAGVFRCFAVCLMICFLSCFVTCFRVLAESSRMLGTLVCGIGFRFGARGRAAPLDFLAFFLGHFVSFGG
jgi:hypothetical protein